MLSPSMKSVSASAAPANKWRLNRTLKRATDFRPIEADDIKYLWAAYKKGGLASMGFDPGMSPEEFKQAFEKAVTERCHAGWTLFAMTRNGFIPVGIVLAAWAPNAPYLIVTGAVFMPWASKRNIIECMVNFLNGVRREVALQFYATAKHRRLYEVCQMHSVVRRVGTSYVAIPGEAAAVFETKSDNKRVH